MAASKSDADKQIEQMIQFIAQEAREKSEEIAVKIASEVEEERQMKIQELSASIREEYEQKSKEKAIAARIERSKALNNQRYLGMRHRDDLMKSLKDDVRKKFVEISNSPKYSELLCFLMAQGFLTIQEKEVTVKCRKEDLALVEKQLPKAVQLYQSVVNQKLGVTPEIKADVEKGEFLPPGSGQGETCTGGVEISAKGRQLICRNTLDSRLERCFYQLAPQLRGLLFGVRAAPATAAH